MGVFIKPWLGLFSVLGSLCAIAYPISTISRGSFNNFTKVNSGEGDKLEQSEIKCSTLEQKVSSSIYYLMGLDTTPGFGAAECQNKNENNISNFKVILRREKKEAYSEEENKNSDGTAGILSLVNLATDSISNDKSLSTWGDVSKGGSGSLSNTSSTSNSKSFVLTGSKNDGEYLMGVGGLKNVQDQSEGKVLVAKKETASGLDKATVKLGGSNGKQENNSSQIQIRKEDLNDGVVSLEFTKYRAQSFESRTS